MIMIEDGIFYGSRLDVRKENDLNVCGINDIVSIEIDNSFVYPRIGVSRKNRRTGRIVLQIDFGDLDNMNLTTFVRKLYANGFKGPRIKKVKESDWSEFVNKGFRGDQNADAGKGEEYDG